MKINGNGFGDAKSGMAYYGSSVGITGDLNSCQINSWSDTEILASCPVQCPSTVEVNTMFSSASATVGNDATAGCTLCHGDNTALVACDNNKWVKHLRRKVVPRNIFEAVEISLLGGLCSEVLSSVSEKERTKK